MSTGQRRSIAQMLNVIYTAAPVVIVGLILLWYYLRKRRLAAKK